MPWRPGALELLTSLTEAGVRCALVTMSWARFVDPILAALPAGVFSAVVTGDTVDRGKPHPEPYLTAARQLDVLAGECLAIEDSDTGATSAAAAGCTVLCAPLHVSVPPGPRPRVHRLPGRTDGVEPAAGLATAGCSPPGQSLRDRDLLRARR